MSKVYIRSQDKEELVLFGCGINSIYYQLIPERQFEQNTCVHAVVAIGKNLRYRLGIYESKERCLEIMDEIQIECGKYYESTGGFSMPNMLFETPTVYQMPEK